MKNKKKWDYTEFDFFTNRIEYALNLMNIKKGRFYSDLELPRQTIMNWKNGSIPSVNIFFKIADYLDVDPNWLLYGKSTNKDKPNSPANQVKRIRSCLKIITNKQPSDIDFYKPLNNLISPILLSKWELGMQIPTLEQLEIVAAQLDMNLIYLLNGTVQESISDNNLYVDKQYQSIQKYYSLLNVENKQHVDAVIKSFFYKQL